MADQAHSHVSLDDSTSSFHMQTRHCLVPISKIKGEQSLRTIMCVLKHENFLTSSNVTKFQKHTVTRSTQETLAPRHNPVDIPPQPEKRSSSASLAL